MRFKTIKSASEIQLAGVKVSIDQVNDCPQAVTVTDEQGKLLRISLRSYALSIETLAPPKTEKRWQLSGTLCGATINAWTFDDEHAARRQLTEWSGAGIDTNIELKEIEVIVEEEA